MQDEDAVRTRVRERYGAIAREAGSCCTPVVVFTGDGP